MSRQHVLPLSDNQMQLIQSSAFTIPVNWRSEFLQSVASQLSQMGQFTDLDVHVAVQEAIASLHCTTDRRESASNE